MTFRGLCDLGSWNSYDKHGCLTLRTKGVFFLNGSKNGGIHWMKFYLTKNEIKESSQIVAQLTIV